MEGKLWVKIKRARHLSIALFVQSTTGDEIVLFLKFYCSELIYLTLKLDVLVTRKRILYLENLNIK